MKDYSNQNLQGASFTGHQLSEANFSGSDLRGADFSGADLSRANFTSSRTGIRPTHSVLLFSATLVVSLFSGYVAMLAGRTAQQMIESKDPHVHASGMVTVALEILLVVAFYLNGVGKTVKSLVLPTCIIALAVGLVSYLTHFGTGMGMVYLVLTIFLLTIMFIIGTIARTVAGALSSTLLFLVVAFGGGIFGRSIGGGIGTVVMAISCMQISKKALAGAKGFESLRKMAFSVTRRLGTSFREANISNADFSGAKIHNADFTGAGTSLARWDNTKVANSISGSNPFTVNK